MSMQAEYCARRSFVGFIVTNIDCVSIEDIDSLIPPRQPIWLSAGFLKCDKRRRYYLVLAPHNRTLLVMLGLRFSWINFVCGWSHAHCNHQTYHFWPFTLRLYNTSDFVLPSRLCRSFNCRYCAGKSRWEGNKYENVHLPEQKFPWTVRGFLFQ